MERKAMLGHKVRRLRRERGLTQAQMAEMLGISPSYLNLIENNQRPLTVPLLLKLGNAFDVDLQAFAEDEETRLLASLKEVFADPLFGTSDLKRQDFRELASVNPALAQAVVTLYQAYRETREDMETLAERVADRDKLQIVQTQAFPIEEAREFFHAQSNHFPEIEEAAETLWRALTVEHGDVFGALVDFLNREVNVRVKVMPGEVMGQSLRRFDRHSRRILLSELLPGSGRTFQLAYQIALLQHRDLLDAVTASHTFSVEETRRLVRIGLANYFAGAVMMPYQRFLDAARAVRYDIEILESRFNASFEQVCHRLTTMQRPGAKGVPFFMVRVDKAGNVSKRFSATSLHFARFGGACPRWTVHDAFRTPGQMLTQLARMPDGTAYFSVARTVTKSSGGFRSPPQQFAIALGCEVQHAGQLVYADGIDLQNTEAATPIGVNCRLCPRLDCSQRAFPPLNQRLLIDENLRGLSTYTFVPGAGV
ncbi:short-chain fatty acyl-CoA regulator family protein [Arenibaculum pallidiluteum]|uniref:short-chain fatty acyl-CoA regulator family protein n=1 Tax=Arenibaculum pallidiluteum TaxID=2812559 RepID=UPI002E28ACED|nr:short-chain fatty acyl-CoA regulator family protein [Arenibaculum pallidiluteum]